MLVAYIILRTSVQGLLKLFTGQWLVGCAKVSDTITLCFKVHGPVSVQCQELDPACRSLFTFGWAADSMVGAHRPRGCENIHDEKLDEYIADIR